MLSTLRVETTVLPGNRIEITAPELAPGTRVEVIVVEKCTSEKQSILDFLESLPAGPGLFKTPEDVDRYTQEERNSWER